MPRVVLMCGPAGSGKSSAARQLELAGLARLCFDDLAWQHGVRTMPVSDQVADAIERDLDDRLLTLVRDGRDVVVDRAFWSRRMRGRYRQLLAPFGVDVETIFVNTPREVALARVAARRSSVPAEYPLPSGLAADYFDNFEIPTPDEGPLTVVPGVEADDAAHPMSCPPADAP